TVDVTLATAPAYELTKADTNKFRVNMDDTLLQIIDVAKSSVDNKYTLTLASSLSGKQGMLSVNNIKAVIPNSEFSYDFKKPTVKNVEVVDRFHVKVNFSERIDITAEIITNYTLYKSS